MEHKTPKDLKPLSFLGKSISSICSGSLFSAIITLYALILLYFPSIFFDIFFSPVFTFTGIILLALLRLGAIQRTEYDSISTPTQPLQESKKNSCPLQEDAQIQKQAIPISNSTEPDHNVCYSHSFREWNVRAPLEVIYEEYGEGEDEDDDDESEDYNKEDDRENEVRNRVLDNNERYPTSLSMYYPESDSDSSSEDGDYAVIGNWESSEGSFFKWNEEDREELIEIALDGKKNCRDEYNVVEEDNLIEIDIFPARD